LTWTHSKVVTYKTYRDSGLLANSIRDNTPIKNIENGGWHFSYFGTPEFISNKIKNFSHQEFNSPEYTDVENIQRRIDMNTDVYGRDWVKILNCPMDTTILPDKYEMLLDMCKGLNGIH